MDSEWQGLLLGKAYEKEEEIEDGVEPTLKEFEQAMKKELQASWEELKKVIKEEIRREIRAGFKEMGDSLFEKLNLPSDTAAEVTNNTIIKKKPQPRY